MALEFMCGFEFANSGANDLASGGTYWTAIANFNASTLITARTGSRSALMGSAFAIGTKLNMSNAVTRISGMGINFIAVNNSGNRVVLSHGDGDPNTAGNCQVSLALNNDGSMSVYRGRGLGLTSGGTLLGSTAAGVLPANNIWYYIELVTTINGATGTVDIYVDNVNVLSLTGQNTQSTANAYSNSIGVCGTAGGFYLDDYYTVSGSGGLSTTRLGAGVRIVGIVASTGNGANAQFTPSSGVDHGAMVDDTTQDGDTTYNASTTIGFKDTYNFAAVGRVGNVKGVNIRNTCRSDSGVAGIRHISRISGTDYFSAAQSLGVSWTQQHQLQETSPATAAAWTVTEIDAAEFGIEHNS